jgi:hypothetical protein
MLNNSRPIGKLLFSEFFWPKITRRGNPLVRAQNVTSRNKPRGHWQPFTYGLWPKTHIFYPVEYHGVSIPLTRLFLLRQSFQAGRRAFTFPDLFRN